MLINKWMERELRALPSGDISLPPELTKIVSDGFVEVQGCFVLRHFFETNKHVMVSDFVDKIAFECFLNHIHIDDYAEENLLWAGLKFTDALVTTWRNADYNATLNVIVAIDEMNVTVRCHVDRPPLSWLSPNLEGYDEGILVVTSRDEGWTLDFMANAK